MEEIFDRKAIFQRLNKIDFDYSLYDKIEGEVLDELKDYLLFFGGGLGGEPRTLKISTGAERRQRDIGTGRGVALNMVQDDGVNIRSINALSENDIVVAVNILHNVNYVMDYLRAIFGNLAATGVFCGNFFGVNNLSILKQIIMANDLVFSKRIAPRFNPCISGENVCAMLQAIGFANIVSSIGKIVFDFDSFGDAVTFLKNVNERNYLVTRQKDVPIRKIFKENLEGKVTLDFEIVKFYCQKK